MALTQVSKDVLNNSQANITQVGTLANLTVTGNITTNGKFIGDGSLLTLPAGVNSSYTDANVANYLTANPQPGTYSNTNVASYLTSASISTSGNISAARFTGNGASLTGLTATMVGLGNVTNESKATMFSSPTFTGTVTMQQAVELYSSPSISANAVTLNFTNGAIFALGSNASNITANFTNIPGTVGQTIVTTLIITQGATAYIPSAVTINSGSSTTIRWLGGSAPTGTANRTEIVSFTFVCTATNTWTVLGSLSSFG